MIFGNKKINDDKDKKNMVGSSPNTHALNSLVKGTYVEGIVTSESDIRVDGIIKGTLSCKAKVIIGPSGHIEGEVRCANAVIEGKFQGVLHVLELLNVRETADVTGDVYTNKLIVQSGANFNGACKMASESPVLNPNLASTNGAMKPKEAKAIVTNVK